MIELSIMWPAPEIIKLVMLNSAEHEIFPAHKCFENANNCWHFKFMS